ncbi:secretion system apparatus protein SsaG [Salmonella enterica subsp. enterica serovar Typhi]|uniref:Type III secretion system needle protein SsaG n=1 Tax=Salmonella enterica subsp. enterica serovar Typhi str. CT18 TaxID=220341 RepID=A0A714VCJ2_SALTI|nr:type III secretion system needle protein SsaG [Salmonella enterica]CHO45993.1 secretion system apparatus protein SsaG [Salmonella enterica subsp. enterica serovar Typhi]HAD4297623.1 type III secretion system needle protein SsaG [Salmonella enterica subsp. enterica serovar Typhi str. CT18]CHQ82070.1 secretion system apparatus protein SsaG [Salmonella enterica subsp. enterica serovar Typhi]CHR08362.1 secretion system apparatus protein SsaG [Salmonella enterica subsp. enterica serovar Typhi]
MDIAQLVDMLSYMAHQAGQAINDKMNGNDLLNPESMIKAQFALQQYSTFINYESSLIKMIKDMLSGIIAKI